MKFKMLHYTDGIIYVMLTALSFVFIDQLAGYINPIVSLFIMASLATVWFQILSWRKLKQLYIICTKEPQYWLLAVIVAINWLSSMYAPHYADPFLYLAIYFITLAIYGFVSMYISTKKIAPLISSTLLIISLLVIAVYYDIDHQRSLWIGFVLGWIGGITAAIYAKLSASLCKKYSLGSREILAIRFIPLCLVLILFLHFEHVDFLITLKNVLTLLIMSIISLIIPVYYYQQSIIKLGVNQSAILVAFTPVVTFILFSYSIKHIDYVNLAISIIVLVALLAPRFMDKLIKSHWNK
jgi:drug/metabolite transporter (DMT)-like permease